MASNDPFEFLSKTRATPETITSLEQSAQGEKNVNTSKPDPFDFLSKTSQIQFKGEAPKPTGPIGAFAEGVGSGLLKPFTFITKPLLGYEYTPDPGITSWVSKISEVLGNFAGLGVSFYAFSGATGVALKGLGLTTPLIEKSPELYNFVKGTLAGTAQFTGESTNLEEAKSNAIKGAAFGAAVEGLFLAASLRSRSGRVLWPSNRSGPLTGTDVALRPDLSPRAPSTVTGLPTVMPSQLAKEIEIAPSEFKTADRMQREIKSLFNPDPIPETSFEVQYPGPNPQKAIPAKSGAAELPVVHKPITPTIPEGIDNVLVDLAHEHLTTTRITNVTDPTNLVAYAKAKLSSTAQIVVRASQGAKEILIHNPYHEGDVLSPEQIAQWKKSGVYDGMEAIYNNKSYAFTGEQVAPGKVQLRDPKNPGRVFAPNASSVTVPVAPKYFPKSPGALAIKQSAEAYIQALAESVGKVGFVIPSNEPGSARRGIIDISQFEEHTSVNAFAKKYKTELDKISSSAANLNIQSKENLLNILAQQKGIKGIVIKDGDFMTDIHIFDQGSVKFVQEPPRFGMTLDRTLISADAQTGKMNLHSIQPSWKNMTAGILRDRGFPEKEINRFLDERAQFFGKSLDDLMSPEFKTIKKVSEGQFYEGCF